MQIIFEAQYVALAGQTPGSLPAGKQGFGLSLIFLCYFLCIKAKKVRWI
jgi:hypothetical protein